MEQIKPPGKKSLLSCLQDFQLPYQVREKGHFLAVPGTSGYLWGPQEEKDFTPIYKSIGTAGEV